MITSEAVFWKSIAVKMISDAFLPFFHVHLPKAAGGKLTCAWQEAFLIKYFA